MLNGIHRVPDMDRVVYGRPFAAGIKSEIERLDAHAVFMLASGTLVRETDTLEQVRQALGNRLAGVAGKIAAHTPRDDVVLAANDARAAKADLLLTIGGGSITDAAKMIGLCLGNDVNDPAQLDAFRTQVQPDGSTRRPPIKPPGIRAISVPTTLSAGEYTWYAGCTDPVTHVKESFAHPLMVPRIVILDPAITRHTPEWLLLSTGLRAVDHAVEGICSIEPAPLADAASLHALRLLSRGLRAVKANANDLEARLDCQLGAWLSMMGAQDGVPMGASHAIGHVLGGTAGVPHGYTSCVMLPHVLRFNAKTNPDRQAWVSEALGSPGTAAGDAVAELVAALGLPGRLRDVGVKPEQLDLIARHSMHDRWLHTNPRNIEGPEIVRQILDAAW
jgi:maleylacetate reductase